MRNLFIVAPFYPPSSLPPSQRVRMIVNHLYKFDWNPIVFTVNSKYREEKEDNQLLAMTKSDVEVVHLNGVSSSLSRKFGVGDLGLRIFPFLFKALLKRSKIYKPDFILFLVPPWYILLLAPIIKKIRGIPYGIDFIDPWVQIEGYQKNIKGKMSQRVARLFESWVVKNADFIYSVSESINDEIKRRVPKMTKNFSAIPYGVEMADFGEIENRNVEENHLTFRYIGAVWPLSIPVVDALLESFKLLTEETLFKVEFIGTSYAGDDLSEKQLDDLILGKKLDEYVSEIPNRIAYTNVLKLYSCTDVLFLFGDMGSQYAASKLMNIIASRRPFFAFLHRNTYPFKILDELGFPYLVGYSNVNGDLPKDQILKLKMKILELVNHIDNFNAIDMNVELLKNKTAEGMTKDIVEGINKCL